MCESLFRYAVEVGDLPVVDFLLKKGVSPNGHKCRYKFIERMSEPLDPLQVACSHGYIKMVLKLLEYGAKVVEPEAGLTFSLLTLAIIGANRGVLHGPSYPFIETPGRHVVIEEQNNQEELAVRDPLGEANEKRELVAKQGDDSPSSEGLHMGSTVTEAALLRIIKILVLAGARTNPAGRNLEKQFDYNSDYQQTPLSAASKYLNLSVVEYLLAHGADVNFPSGQGTSPLQDCMYSWEEMHRTSWRRDLLPLLERAGPIWWRLSRAYNIYHVAYCLLQGGADPQHIPASKVRAKSAANSYDSLGLCRGPNMLDLAILTGHTVLVQTMLDRAARITNMSLHYTLQLPDSSLFILLLHHGAFSITRQGLSCLSNKNHILKDLILFFRQQHQVGTRMQMFAMLAAIACGSEELMQVVLSFSNFDWQTLLSFEYAIDRDTLWEPKDLATTELEGPAFNYENCAIKELEEATGLPDDVPFYATNLRDAVACCARTGRLEVFHIMVSSIGLRTSPILPLVALALRNLIGETYNGRYNCWSEASLDPLANSSLSLTTSTLWGAKKCTAIEDNRNRNLTKLLDTGVSVNENFHFAGTAYPGTILATAIECGSDYAVAELLRRGADINAVGLSYEGSADRFIRSPLVAAILARKRRWVDYLIDKGANVNCHQGTTDEYTPLEAALEVGERQLIDKLLGRGAEARLGYMNTLLEQALEDGQYEDFKEILINQTLDVNSVCTGCRPLSYALEVTWVDEEDNGSGLVEPLLKAGADPNLPRNDDNHTYIYPLPLQKAVNRDSCKSAKLLLEAGAWPNATPAGCFLTALHTAVIRKNHAIVQLLLTNGALPNPKLKQEHDESENGRSFSLGLPFIGDKEAQVLQRNSPLQIAAREGCLDIVETLIEYGATINAPAAEKAGATALQYAAMYGFLPIADLLVRHGADVNAAGAKVDGRTALEGAAEHGRIDMVPFLLSAGADIYDGEQYTRAVKFARDNGHNALADMLVDHHDGVDR